MIGVAARRAALVVTTLLTCAAPVASGPSVTEGELVKAFLSRDATAQRQALAAARRQAAELARVTAPSWRVEALREESRSASTAFTTEVLSVGVELELARANAAERRRAAAEATARELGAHATRVESVTELRSFVLAAWLAEREAALLEAGVQRVGALLAELTRLVEAGEQARFDLERLRAFAAAGELRARMAAAAARAESARLKALTGRDATGLVLAHERTLPLPRGLVELVLASHPLLRALRQHVEESGLAVEVADRTHPGRLDLRAGYRRDDEPGLTPGDGYEVEAAYLLPSAALRERDAALARSEKGERELKLARAERRVAAEVEAALARVQAFASVGEAGDDLDAVRAGSTRRYRSGEATLTELIDVLARLEERELLALRAAAARRAAMLELDRASGLVTAPEIGRQIEEMQR